jgi:lipoprotein-releasing system ATP-binding protein
MSDTVLACAGLKKTYLGPTPVSVLAGVDLEVRPSERIVIVGRSGSGKSTLLHLLGGLDAPSAGTVTVRGRAFSRMSEAERGRVRNATLGFVYQFHHLLPEFTALENVAMPLVIRRMDSGEAHRRAAGVLEEVGLGERLEHRPGDSAAPSRARWSPSPPACWPTSRPETSMRAPRTRCSRRCCACRRRTAPPSSSSRTMRRSRRAPSASSSCAAAFCIPRRAPKRYCRRRRLRARQASTTYARQARCTPK